MHLLHVDSRRTRRNTKNRHQEPTETARRTPDELSVTNTRGAIQTVHFLRGWDSPRPHSKTLACIPYTSSAPHILHERTSRLPSKANGGASTHDHSSCSSFKLVVRPLSGPRGASHMQPHAATAHQHAIGFCIVSSCAAACLTDMPIRFALARVVNTSYSFERRSVAALLPISCNCLIIFRASSASR